MGGKMKLRKTTDEWNCKEGITSYNTIFESRVNLLNVAIL